mmetsp:Transcript_42076/g.69068  ORF Transcript_42076/g.69068 Transcript_42076/m.69068 type:complete len:143 (+) Transcript_42076:387-815(+)
MHAAYIRCCEKKQVFFFSLLLPPLFPPFLVFSDGKFSVFSVCPSKNSSCCQKYTTLFFGFLCVCLYAFMLVVYVCVCCLPGGYVFCVVCMLYPLFVLFLSFGGIVSIFFSKNIQESVIATQLVLPPVVFIIMGVVLYYYYTH